MNEMVERVTQAVRAVQIPIMRGEDMIGVTQVPAHMAERIARAAIVAMRDPTRDMVAAANRNNHPRDEETWRTMIDEALKQS